MWYQFLVLFFPLLIGCADPASRQTLPVDKKGGDCQYYYDSRLKTRIYTKVEIEAEYEGGTVAYQRFLNKNLQIPQEQADLGELQSNVSMEFIVDASGQLLLPGISGRSDSTQYTPLDKEALRVLRLMPKWKPALCNGKKITSLVKRPMIICYEETP